jgi:hypothetical protein
MTITKYFDIETMLASMSAIDFGAINVLTMRQASDLSRRTTADPI